MMVVEQTPDAPQGTDEAAFERFFREHFGRVYGLLYRVTGSAEEAEDLAQELFLQVARRRPPLWEGAEAGGYLWKAASHAALNALRGARRRREREERAAHRDRPLHRSREWDEDPAERLARHERRDAVRAVLRRLRSQESALLLLRHSGLSYADVAAALGLNPASVGTLLARAERRFAALWAEEEPPDIGKLP
jgi:RNA polymerase sigma-70 factor (ECF subfamily)